MRWSEVPAAQACMATPPKDQILIKLDTEGRIKLLSVFRRVKTGKRNPAI